ncbi:hypothetical protein [Tumebacillus lipolyticus]|uniref:Uncharacterized protein n=1 Tax=Tumebacillus lipolyticus TaxID=1280370 RepID=A0ABW4ZS44_9BACL
MSEQKKRWTGVLIGETISAEFNTRDIVTLERGREIIDGFIGEIESRGLKGMWYHGILGVDIANRNEIKKIQTKWANNQCTCNRQKNCPVCA